MLVTKSLTAGVNELVDVTVDTVDAPGAVNVSRMLAVPATLEGANVLLINTVAVAVVPLA